jgi:hypothetical protein
MWNWIHGQITRSSLIEFFGLHLWRSHQRADHLKVRYVVWYGCSYSNVLTERYNVNVTINFRVLRCREIAPWYYIMLLWCAFTVIELRSILIPRRYPTSTSTEMKAEATRVVSLTGAESVPASMDPGRRSLPTTQPELDKLRKIKSGYMIIWFAIYVIQRDMLCDQ